MCTYVTGVLDATADTASFRNLVAKYRLRFESINNPNIMPQLRAGERYYHVTYNPCDCSTTLKHRENPSGPSERDIEKLRTKGWSEAKIARWTESKRSAGDRPPPRGDGLSQDEWFAFIDEVLGLQRNQYLGLMMHFYKWSTHNEAFTIQDRVRIRPTEIRTHGFCWKENVLYDICATASM
jgi:hypothetical protein